MSLTVKEPENSGDFDVTPAGLYHGILYSVYDLGSQSMTWKGNERLVERVMLMWELPEERIEIDGKDLPRAISKEYTNSLAPKANLLADLTKWRGVPFTDAEKKGFLLTKLLGVNCTLQVIHNVSESNGKTYANVESIIPMMQGVSKKIPENPLTFYEFGAGKPIPDHAPEWIIKKIHAAAEWGAEEAGPTEANVHPVGEPESDQVSF